MEITFSYSNPKNLSDIGISRGSNTCDTVVLVGNGAVENGSIPLRTGLNKWMDKTFKKIHPKINDIRRKDSESYHQLAVNSYLFRLYKLAFYYRIIDPKNKFEFNDTFKGSLEYLHTRDFTDFRELIAEQYCELENALQLRMNTEIEHLIGKDALYITTNWDNSLWKRPELENIIHVHGRCKNPHSIVFPTELLIEEHQYDGNKLDDCIRDCPEELRYLVHRAFRHSTRSDLLRAFSNSIGAINNAKKIVIWGYSLADYDADINALIGYASSKAEELIVINPSIDAFHRAAALTGNFKAKHFDPIKSTLSSLN